MSEDALIEASKEKSRQRSLISIARNMTLTPLDNALDRTIARESQTKSAGPASPAELEKQKYKEDEAKWEALIKISKKSKDSDPLTFAQLRLETFTQYYKIYIEGGTKEKAENVSDMITFWSINALKLITGIDKLVTSLISNYYNMNAKEDEKIKILKINDDYFGIQWSWTLAMNFSAQDIYSYTRTRVPYVIHTDYHRKPIGPSNHYTVHGNSLTNIPFSNRSFPVVLAYDLWFHLKNEDWVPVLSELYRVTSNNGYLNLMLIDFTILNCRNEVYRYFFERVRDVLERDGLDPFPCKRIQGRLREAGFKKVEYAVVSLRKGSPDKIGALMEFLHGYFELMIFRHIALVGMNSEDLELFKLLRMQYTKDVQSERLLDEFGDGYLMMVIAQKTS